MSNKAQTQWSIIKKHIVDVGLTGSSVLDDFTLMNVHRIHTASLIAIPVHMAHIILFLTTVSETTPEQIAWKHGIIIAHSILLIIMLILFFITRQIRKQLKPTALMHILQYATVSLLLAAGVAITCIDQGVTSNITPFLIVCLICGMVFLIRPHIILAIYLLTYLTFYLTLALVDHQADVLLSNRVNGLTAIAIGFTLSIMLWRSNATNLSQKKHINMQQEQLEQVAYIDFLTGFPNRRFFDELIRKELAGMQRHDHESSLIILDIDNFKDTNDRLGHPAGDQVLRQLADLLLHNIRQSDTISRLGGEEFIILLPDTSLQDTLNIAEKLRQLIEHYPFSIHDQTIKITASFGAARLQAQKNQSLFGYYTKADKALYMAKDHGKNRVEIVEAL